ncbi:MAG: serine kinase [Anaerolineae bacterium]|nr:serine kinase [Anaerolineae bacterium]
MYRYTAYGLHIQSALAMPELLAADQTEPDVTIRYGSLGLEIPPKSGYITYLQAAPQEVCLTWGSVANLLVRDGNDITIDPQPGADERSLRLFALGAGMGVLLHQRRKLILHASAVAIDGRIAVFTGNSGWGKSTTAAAFHACGHRMMADDLVVVEMQDDQPVVVPGYPQLKLWPESVEALGADPNTLPQVRREVDKRAQATRDQFADSPLPLGAIYVLDGGDELRIDPLPPKEALMALIRNLFIVGFGSEYSRATQDHTSFPQCAELAKRVPVRLLRRQVDLTALPRLVELVEDDFRQAQPVTSLYGV